MLSECPDPKEVSDFHFLQLRTLRLVKPNEYIFPTKYVNLLASASQYDLLFVGFVGGFKVLKLKEILASDEDKANRSILEKYWSSFVSCDTPVLLAVNATQTVLAVCTRNAFGCMSYFYSLSDFFGFDRPWQPFWSKILSPPGFEIKDFAWNPAIEELYSYCLSDGSLHIHEISGTTIKVFASLPNANALSVCWSPKGKQLVVGKSDGLLVLYKFTLDPVTEIRPPSFEDGPVSVTSICWISETVFAVVYVTNDMPNLFIVSTAKGAPDTYANFNDVCLGNNSIPDQKYFMHLEPSWGLMICASVDSKGIAVLGDMPNWVQWDLKEDAKLPGKDGAMNAVGMTVMYSAQKQIISDGISYPPMPVMFLLTDNGLLVSFHMVNEKPNAPNLVSSPVPVYLNICWGDARVSGSGADMTEKKSFMFPTASLTPSTSVIGSLFSQNSPGDFGEGPFFSGLWDKPSEENASKNVFGIGSSVKSSDTNSFVAAPNFEGNLAFGSPPAFGQQQVSSSTNLSIFKSAADTLKQQMQLQLEQTTKQLSMSLIPNKGLEEASLKKDKEISRLERRVKFLEESNLVLQRNLTPYLFKEAHAAIWEEDTEAASELKYTAEENSETSNSSSD